MKLLLVLGSDDNYDVVSKNTQSLGFEEIRYRHVLKAMDNIDEVDPAAIIISARDFPRHWKILLQFIRSERSKEACPVIILRGGNFNAEETSKAFFLGANGVLADTLDNKEDIDRLQEILGRPAPEHEERQGFPVEPWHRIGLLIAGFSGKAIVAADVKTICANGLSFSPVHHLSAKAVKLNKELKECSLRAGDAILSPTCRIIDSSGSNGNRTISLEFASFPDGEEQVFDEFYATLTMQT